MRAVYVCDAYMRACARRACRECAVGENQCVCVLTMLAMPYGDHNQWGGVLGVVWVPHDSTCVVALGDDIPLECSCTPRTFSTTSVC